MTLSGAGGLLETEYRHPMAGERHTIRMFVAHFDPTPVATAFGDNDRVYIAGGPVAPTEASVLETFAALAALWAPYYSPNWSLAVNGLQERLAGNRTWLSPAPVAATVPGSESTDDDTGPRCTRHWRLVGKTGAVRGLWLAQTRVLVQPESPVEVTPTSGGLDGRDRAWMAYLSGASGGGAVMPDGTYCFAVTNLRTEWARPLEAASWVLPGSPYIVSGP